MLTVLPVTIRIENAYGKILIIYLKLMEMSKCSTYDFISFSSQDYKVGLLLLVTMPLQIDEVHGKYQ